MKNASPLTATEILARQQEVEFRYNKKKANHAYNYDIRDVADAFAYNLLAQTFGSENTKENKVENYQLSDLEKICIDSMVQNNETLGTMTLVILQGSGYRDGLNCIAYYITVGKIRKAIQKYIGGEDD